LDLTQKITGDISLLEQIYQPYRYFIRDGDVTITWGETAHIGSVYLFNDSILIALRKGKSLKLKNFLPFPELTTVSRKEDKDIIIGYNDTETIGQLSMTLQFATPEIRESWLKQIVSTMTSNIQRGSMRAARN